MCVCLSKSTTTFAEAYGQPVEWPVAPPPPIELTLDLYWAVTYAAPDEPLGTFIRLRSLLNRAVRGLVRGPANAPVQRLVRASGWSTCGAC